jgi:hypothetical protein
MPTAPPSPSTWSAATTTARRLGEQPRPLGLPGYPSIHCHRLCQPRAIERTTRTGSDRLRCEEREDTEATPASQALRQPSRSLHHARPQPPSLNPAASSQIRSPDAATRRQPPRRPLLPDPTTCAGRRGGGGSYRGHPGLPGAAPAPAPRPPRAHAATVVRSSLLAPPSTRRTSLPRGPPNRARDRCRWQTSTGSACPPSIRCRSATALSPT